MSLTPAIDEKTKRERREAIELCGKNRGSHDYIAIEKRVTIDNCERVTRLMCLVCFRHVSIETLLQDNPPLKY